MMSQKFSIKMMSQKFSIKMMSQKLRHQNDVTKIFHFQAPSISKILVALLKAILGFNYVSISAFAYY